MSKLTHSRLFKVIAFVLIASFIALDISWAYPPDPTVQNSTLAAPSILQQQPINDHAARFQRSILSDGILLGSLHSIAKYLLEDKLPLNYLESVMKAELGDAVTAINLKEVGVNDGIVSIPCVIKDKDCKAYIALKNNARAAQSLSGGLLDVDSKYLIKVLPRGAERIDALVRYVMNGDVDTSELETQVAAVFPELNFSGSPLPYKLKHVLAVVQALNRLINGNGNLEYFYKSLRAREKDGPRPEPQDVKDRYIESLGKLFEIYSALPEDEKRELVMAVILHDIGYTEADATDEAHPLRGAELASFILSDRGLSDDSIGRISDIISHHDVMGNIARGKKVPRLLKDLPEKLLKLIVIANAMDMAGYGTGVTKVVQNNLLPSVLEELLKYADKEEISRLDSGGYYEYRLGKLARPGYGKELNGEQRELLDKAISEVIPPGMLADFSYNWNSRIEVMDPSLFFGVVKGNSYERLAKFLKIISLTADAYFRAHPEAADFVVDTDIDLKSLSSEDREVLFAPLRAMIDAMPQGLTVSHIGAAQNLRDLCGLPLTLEGNRLIVVLEPAFKNLLAIGSIDEITGVSLSDQDKEIVRIIAREIDAEIRTRGGDRHIVDILSETLKNVTKDEAQNAIKELIGIVSGGDDAEFDYNNLAYQALVSIVRTWPKRHRHAHMGDSIHEAFVWNEMVFYVNAGLRQRFMASIDAIDRKKFSTEEMVWFEGVRSGEELKPWHELSGVERIAIGKLFKKESFPEGSQKRRLSGKDGYYDIDSWARAVTHVALQHIVDGVRDLDLSIKVDRPNIGSPEELITSAVRGLKDAEELAGRHLGGKFSGKLVISFAREKSEPVDIKPIVETALKLKAGLLNNFKDIDGKYIAGFDIAGGEFIIDRPKINTFSRRTSEYLKAISEVCDRVSPGLLGNIRLTSHLGDWGNTYRSTRQDDVKRGTELSDIPGIEERVEYHLDFIEDALKSGLLTDIQHGIALAPEGSLITKDPREFKGKEYAGKAVTVIGSSNLSRIDDVLERLKRLRVGGIEINACPTVNARSQKVRLYKGHPLHKWIERGNNVSINVDDFYSDIHTTLSDDVVKMMLTAPTDDRIRRLKIETAKEITSSISISSNNDVGKSETSGVKNAADEIVDLMAKRDELPQQADLLVVFGSGDNRVAVEAAKLYHSRKISRVLVAGKYGGHVTPDTDNPDFGRDKNGVIYEAEALIYKRILMENGVPEDVILVEKESQGMTDNGVNSVRLLNQRGLIPDTIIFMHAPLLQLRGSLSLRSALAQAGIGAIVYDYAAPLTIDPNKDAAAIAWQAGRLTDDTVSIIGQNKLAKIRELLEPLKAKRDARPDEELKASISEPIADVTAPAIVSSIVQEIVIRKELTPIGLFTLAQSKVPESMQNLRKALTDLRPLAEKSDVSADDILAAIKEAERKHSLSKDETNILWLALTGPGQGAGSTSSFSQAAQPSLSDAAGVMSDGALKCVTTWLMRKLEIKELEEKLILTDATMETGTFELYKDGAADYLQGILPGSTAVVSKTQGDAKGYNVSVVNSGDSAGVADNEVALYVENIPGTDRVIRITAEKADEKDLFTDVREQLKLVTVINALTNLDGDRAAFEQYLGGVLTDAFFNGICEIRQKHNKDDDGKNKIQVGDITDIQKLCDPAMFDKLKSAVDRFIYQNDLLIEFVNSMVERGLWSYDAAAKVLFLQQIRVGVVDARIVKALGQTKTLDLGGYDFSFQYNPDRQNRASTGTPKIGETLLDQSFIEIGLPLERWVPFHREGSPFHYLLLPNPFPHLRNSINLVSKRINADKKMGDSGDVAPQDVVPDNIEDAFNFLERADAPEGHHRLRLFINPPYAGLSFDHLHFQGFYKIAAIEHATNKEGNLKLLNDTGTVQYYTMEDYSIKSVIVVEGRDRKAISAAVAKVCSLALANGEKVLSAKSEFTYNILFTYEVSREDGPSKAGKYRASIVLKNLTPITDTNQQDPKKAKKEKEDIENRREKPITAAITIKDGSKIEVFTGKPATVEMVDTLIYDSPKKAETYTAVTKNDESMTRTLEEVFKAVKLEDEKFKKVVTHIKQLPVVTQNPTLSVATAPIKPAQTSKATSLSDMVESSVNNERAKFIKAGDRIIAVSRSNIREVLSSYERILEANDSGWLDRHVPRWGILKKIPQWGPHDNTVGEHILGTLRELDRDPLFHDQKGDKKDFLISLFFHDFGKNLKFMVTPDKHSIEGARIVYDILIGLGFREDEARKYSWYVKQHGVMYVLAYKGGLNENIEDESIYDFMDKLTAHDVDVFTLLYLADMGETFHGNSPAQNRARIIAVSNELKKLVAQIQEDKKKNGGASVTGLIDEFVNYLKDTHVPFERNELERNEIEKQNTKEARPVHMFINLLDGNPSLIELLSASDINEIRSFIGDDYFRGKGKISPGSIAAKTDAENVASADIVNHKIATAEIARRVERAMAVVDDMSDEKVPAGIRADIEFLKKNLAQFEADGAMASLIVLARRAKRENQKLIIGLETDWIPGINEIGYGSQHDAINLLLGEIRSIGQILKDLGLDNVEIVEGSGHRLAGALLDKADNTKTALSNVIVLASSATINDVSFDPLRSTYTEKRAFLAGIDASEIAQFYDANKDYMKTANKQLQIRIMAMLSMTLELAAGKEPPQSPIIVSYDRNLRVLMLLPKADLKDYDELKSDYAAEKTALEAA